MFETTIAAISTPPGTGGIGIVRLSGKDALPIAAKVFRPFGVKALVDAVGYTGMLGRVFDSTGDLDDCIAFVYRAPKSYTGEEVVELSCHGGSWVMQRVLRLCLDAGCTSAAPGEFTKRAFLNGKLGLAEAEAVMDLISAQGDAALRAALSARDGALSTAIAAIVEKLLAQSAHLAAWADYPDEEIETVDAHTLVAALQMVQNEMDCLLSTWDRGKILREGVHTAIVGRPNVGKSTLMNLLVGEQRSIVTDIPGTTRDVVEDSVRLGDCVLRLADTAGIRETTDPVESLGVDRAKQQLQAAGLVLAVFDSSDTLSDQDLALLTLLADKPCIAIINKVDLPRQLDTAAIEACVNRVVTMSAGRGEGREQLEQAVSQLLGLDKLDATAAMVASERQRSCLTLARESVAEAISVTASGMTLDAVNVTIDYALDHLLSLTGQRATDTVVDQVFAQFCVGK